MRLRQDDYWSIKEFAQEFREGLEYIRNNKLYVRLRVFADFLNECCSYSSDFLAQYLMGNGTFIYYKKEN